MQESANSNEVSALPHAPIDWAGNLAPASITHTIGIVPSEPITAEVYITNVTNLTGQGAGVIAQVGYGISGTAPSTWTAWPWMGYAGDVGDNDAYTATLTPEATGTFQYVARFSTTNGREWTYAGLSGVIVTPTLPTTDAGVLVVNASSDVTPPDAPTNLRLANWNVDSLTLAWDAPTASDVYAYDLYRSSAAQSAGVVARVMSPTFVYTDYGVISGLTYTYTVKALDTSFNASSDSNSVAGTPQQRFVTVTFNVTVPTFTPPGDTICIPGDNARLMGSTWTPSTLPMTKVDATHWTETVTVADGTHLQYKYTRCTSWNVVEWWGSITGTANRQLDINYGATGIQTVNDDVANWRDPIVIDTSPLPGATGVAHTAVITASWSRPIEPATLVAGFKVATANGPVAGTTGFISSTYGYVSVFTPTAPLPGMVFTATLGTGIVGISNDGATLQQPVTWSFSVSPYKFYLDLILKN